jgi:NAD(P)-dependent dehydrogenase (short-subunit alcohol dehydrogenase family)
VQLIRDAGGEAIFVQTDVAKSSDIQAMVRTAVDGYGGLDFAVNNAMQNVGFKHLADIEDDEWDAELAVNLTGVFRCMKYEIRAMLKRGGGCSIVNIGSGNEHTATANLSWYLSAKQGIRVNAVAPGTMWTPALRATVAADPSHLAKRASRSLLGRLAEPEEVAEVVVWLCSAIPCRSMAGLFWASAICGWVEPPSPTQPHIALFHGLRGGRRFG